MYAGDINCEYKWRVDFNCFKTIDQKVNSPIFTVHFNHRMTEWQMTMVRKNDKGEKSSEKKRKTRKENSKDFEDGYLTIFLENLNDFDTTAKVSFIILNDQNQKFEEFSFPNHSFTDGKKCIPTKDVVEISYLNTKTGNNKLLKNNKITVVCKIVIDDSNELQCCLVENKFCKLKHFEMLGNLFMSQESSDIIIKAGEKEFFVHKCIIKTYSSVFKAMLEHDFLDTKPKIEINDIRSDIVNEFLRFIYTGKIDIKGKDIEVEELWYAADKYSIEGLKSYCEDLMCKKISVDNAIKYLKLALTYKSSHLKNNAIKFISCHPNEICHKEELKSFGLLYPDILFDVMNGVVQQYKNKKS